MIFKEDQKIIWKETIGFLPLYWHYVGWWEPALFYTN